MTSPTVARFMCARGTRSRSRTRSSPTPHGGRLSPDPLAVVLPVSSRTRFAAPSSSGLRLSRTPLFLPRSRMRARHAHRVTVGIREREAPMPRLLAVGGVAAGGAGRDQSRAESVDIVDRQVERRLCRLARGKEHIHVADLEDRDGVRVVDGLLQAERLAIETSQGFEVAGAEPDVTDGNDSTLLAHACAISSDAATPLSSPVQA